MPHIFTSALRIGYFLFISFLATSYISPNITNRTLPLESGSYELMSTGEYNMKLKGRIDFEMAAEVSSKGESFSTLRLNLNGDRQVADHSMGFLISKQNTSKKITEGTYRISKNIDGFINYFDGVFGFANIRSFGELPFFARDGKITIKNYSKQNLLGQIEVTLENPNGKEINITGNFLALRKN